MLSYLTIGSLWLAWGLLAQTPGADASLNGWLERAGFTLVIVLVGLLTKRIYLGHHYDEVAKERDGARAEDAMLRRTIKEGHLARVAEQNAILERVAERAERGRAR